MSNVSMKAMLEAGVHFGHQTSRWNPKMGRFIFGERNGVHILDLQKTAKELKKACAFIKEESKKGSKFLFVGTKKQAQEAIQSEAARCGAYCIHEKWLGGTLTNFQTVKKSIERMNELEKWETSGVFKAISKKEASRLSKELARLQKLLGGIREMKVLPDVVFVIDPVDTMGAVREAHVLGIPVVAVCDTNADPDLITLPIPGNDDAARSIKLFCAAVADSILEGKAANEAVKTEDKTVENPVMAQAFESAMLAGEVAEKIDEETKAEVAEEEVKKAEEAKEEAAEEKAEEEKTAKKTAAKKTTAKKPAAKKATAAKKPAAKKTTKAKKAEEVKEEPAAEEKAKETK